MKAVSFCGKSGKGYAFEARNVDAPWARSAGIAIFTSLSGYGRRVVRVVELSGREHDVRPIWMLAEAERYGASEVFVRREADAISRRAVIADLEAGLSPVCLDAHVIANVANGAAAAGFAAAA